MLWTPDRLKLSKLLAEGYEIDAVNYQDNLVYVIADPTRMRYEACENMEDDNLKSNLADISQYYLYVVTEELTPEDDYTPDTNISETLKKTWDYGIIGATYLPDVIRAVWDETAFERNN